MKNPTHRTAHLAAALFLVLLSVSPAAPEPDVPGDPETPSKTLSVSPDGNFLIRRQRADPGEHGEALKNISVCSKEGKVLYEWIGGLGATSVLWSPDSRHVAVNDMPGNGGDQLHLLALNPGTPEVKSLREPDGKKLKNEVQTRHGNFLSSVNNVSLRASEWREGHLWCLVTGTFSPKRDPSVSVPFHHLWVFAFPENDPPLLQEEWTRTDPREKPVRNP